MKAEADSLDSIDCQLPIPLLRVFQCGIWHITNLREFMHGEISLRCQLFHACYSIHSPPSFDYRNARNCRLFTPQPYSLRLAVRLNGQYRD